MPILKSKLGDVEIPSGVGIHEFVLNEAAKYGDKIALVSTWCTTQKNNNKISTGQKFTVFALAILK